MSLPARCVCERKDVTKMGCAGSKLSSSLRDHHYHPALAAANSPQKGHIFFNAKTIHFLSHNELDVKAKLVLRCELKLAKELASSKSSATATSDAKRARRLAIVTLAVVQVLKYALSDFDADSFNKLSNQLSIKHIRKDIMRKHSSSSLRLLAPTTTASAAATTSTSTISSSSSSSASDKDEAAFYNRALPMAIDEFGSFIQENLILINDFDEASNHNSFNENENANAPTTEDTPPTDASVEEQAPAEAATTPSATTTATAAAEATTSLKLAETATAETAAGGATVAVSTAGESSAASPAISSSSSNDNINKEQQKEEDADIRGPRSTWLVGLVCFYFLLTWVVAAAKYTLNQPGMLRVEREQVALGAALHYAPFLPPVSKQASLISVRLRVAHKRSPHPCTLAFEREVSVRCARPHADRLSQLFVVNKKRDEDDEHTCGITTANTIAVHHEGPFHSLSSLRIDWKTEDATDAGFAAHLAKDHQHTLKTLRTFQSDDYNSLNATNSKLICLVGEDVDIEANSQFAAAQYSTYTKSTHFYSIGNRFNFQVDFVYSEKVKSIIT